MAKKYLDTEGVKYLWSKTKEQDTDTLNSAKTYADDAVSSLKSSLKDSTVIVKEAEHATKASNDADGNLISSTYIKNSQKAVVNGVATLDANGKVPSSQLPSYVDDVLEYSNASSFPATGEIGKIYVALDTNKIYRFSGTQYTVISETLSLGETASTAYSGASGKANATAIAALQTLFTNGVANKAFKIVDSSGNALDYSTLKDAITKANAGVNANLSDSSTAMDIATTASSFVVSVKDVSSTAIKGYLSVLDSYASLAASDAVYIGSYMTPGESASALAKYINLTCSNGIKMIVGSKTIEIGTSDVLVGTSQNNLNLKLYGTMSINNDEVLTESDVQAISEVDLNNILI